MPYRLIYVIFGGRSSSNDWTELKNWNPPKYASTNRQ